MPQPGAPRPNARGAAGFADRLRALRAREGITLRDLAERAGLSHQAVSFFENGTNLPVIDTCEVLAAALKVSPAWLAFGVGRGPALEAPGARTEGR